MNPEKMQDPYQRYDRLLVAVDCIIFGFDEGLLKLLLIKRDFEPQKGKWSLMGGFVHQAEGLDEAARRVLHKLTGLSDIYMEQLHGFGDQGRDPAGRVISIAYYALINIHEHDVASVRQHGAEWFPVHEIPPLIFDHERMVEAAKKHLKYKAATQPIGFALLPEKFTIPQLRNLYEALLESPLDKRNFSKRILSMNLLVKLDEKQRGVSKKGAYYYKFDPERYRALVAKGFDFMVK